MKPLMSELTKEVKESYQQTDYFSYREVEAIQRINTLYSQFRKNIRNIQKQVRDIDGEYLPLS